MNFEYELNVMGLLVFIVAISYFMVSVYKYVGKVNFALVLIINPNVGVLLRLMP